MADTFKQDALTLLNNLPWDDDHSWRVSLMVFLDTVPDDSAALSRALSDETLPLSLRESLCWLVARLPYPEFRPTLEKCLLAEEVSLRREAGFALAVVESPLSFTPIATALLKETEPSVRVALVYALYHLPHTNTIPLLTAIALDKNEDVNVRGHAVEGLGEQAYFNKGGYAEEVVQTLLVTLFDPEPEIRYWSAFALSKAGDETVIPHLQTVAAKWDAPVPRWNTTVAEEAQEAIDKIRGRTILEESESPSA